MTRRIDFSAALPETAAAGAQTGRVSASTSGSDFAYLQGIDQSKAARVQRRAQRRMVRAIVTDSALLTW